MPQMRVNRRLRGGRKVGGKWVGKGRTGVHVRQAAEQAEQNRGGWSWRLLTATPQSPAHHTPPAPDPGQVEGGEAGALGLKPEVVPHDAHLRLAPT